MVGQFVRVLIAVAFQTISNVINDLWIWAIWLATDASSHFGVTLLDPRVRVCVRGILYNLHIVLVPFFERHTAVNYVKLIKVVLDSFSSIWRDKVISIA